MPYLLTILILIVSILLFDFQKVRKGRGYVLALAWIMLTLTSGLAYHLGVDVNQRVWLFYNVSEYPVNELGNLREDIGYVIYTYILSHCFHGYVVLQLLTSAFITTAVMLFLKRYSRHFFTALLIYYVFSYIHLNMEVVKTSMAISIFLFAWRFMEERKYLKYYILVVLAASFHFSAIITWIIPLLILPGVRKWFLPGRRMLIMMVLSGLFGYSFKFLWTPLIQFLPRTQTILKLYAGYTAVIESGCTLNFNGITGYILQYLLYPLAAVLLSLKMRNESFHGHGSRAYDSKEGDRLADVRIMSVLGIYIGILGLFVPSFVRFIDYCVIFTIAILGSVSLSNLPERFGGSFFRHRRLQNLIVSAFLILPFFGLRVRTYLQPSGPEHDIPFYRLYYPYQSYLNPKDDADRTTLQVYFMPTNVPLTEIEDKTEK